MITEDLLKEYDSNFSSTALLPKYERRRFIIISFFIVLVWSILAILFFKKLLISYLLLFTLILGYLSHIYYSFNRIYKEYKYTFKMSWNEVPNPISKVQCKKLKEYLSNNKINNPHIILSLIDEINQKINDRKSDMTFISIVIGVVTVIIFTFMNYIDPPVKVTRVDYIIGLIILIASIFMFLLIRKVYIEIRDTKIYSYKKLVTLLREEYKQLLKSN